MAAQPSPGASPAGSQPVDASAPHLSARPRQRLTRRPSVGVMRPVPRVPPALPPWGRSARGARPLARPERPGPARRTLFWRCPGGARRRPHLADGRPDGALGGARSDAPERRHVARRSYLAVIRPGGAWGALGDARSGAACPVGAARPRPRLTRTSGATRRPCGLPRPPGRACPLRGDDRQCRCSRGGSLARTSQCRRPVPLRRRRCHLVRHCAGRRHLGVGARPAPRRLRPLDAAALRDVGPAGRAVAPPGAGGPRAAPRAATGRATRVGARRHTPALLRRLQGDAAPVVPHRGVRPVTVPLGRAPRVDPTLLHRLGARAELLLVARLDGPLRLRPRRAPRRRPGDGGARGTPRRRRSRHTLPRGAHLRPASARLRGAHRLGADARADVAGAELRLPPRSADADLRGRRRVGLPTRAPGVAPRLLGCAAVTQGGSRACCCPAWRPGSAWQTARGGGGRRGWRSPGWRGGHWPWAR
jgi:hypothetical protein